MAALRRRTWRWFAVRVRALPSESAWSYALWPVDPSTGERSRAARPTTVLDDPDEIDAFFARQGAS
jgi:hypothetical protein